jgi:hypothetical protein
VRHAEHARVVRLEPQPLQKFPEAGALQLGQVMPRSVIGKTVRRNVGNVGNVGNVRNVGNVGNVGNDEG